MKRSVQDVGLFMDSSTDSKLRIIYRRVEQRKEYIHELKDSIKFRSYGRKIKLTPVIFCPARVNKAVPVLRRPLEVVNGLEYLFID